MAYLILCTFILLGSVCSFTHAPRIQSLNALDFIASSIPIFNKDEDPPLTTNDITIRPAKFHDLSSVINLRVNVFHPEYVTSAPFHTTSLQKIRKRMDDGAVCLIAHCNSDNRKFGNMLFGKILGTVEFSPFDFLNTAMEPIGAPRKVYAADLAIRRETRRMGIATSLLNEIEAYCRAKQYQEIYMHVEAHNTIARRLYEKCGYVELPFCSASIAFTQSRLQKPVDNYVFIKKCISLESDAVVSDAIVEPACLFQSKPPDC